MGKLSLLVKEFKVLNIYNIYHKVVFLVSDKTMGNENCVGEVGLFVEVEEVVVPKSNVKDINVKKYI